MINDVNNEVRTIDKIIEKLGDLPSAPAILSKAIKLTSDINSNIADISRSLSADQSIFCEDSPHVQFSLVRTNKESLKSG